MIDWYSQLLKYGVEVPTSEQFVINCPLPNHYDRRASCSINTEKGVWICYAGCGQGSLFSLISGISHKAIKQLKNELDTPLIYTSFFDDKSNVKELDVFPQTSYAGLLPLPDDHWIYQRGFTKETLAKWECKQNKYGDFVIPVQSPNKTPLGWITRRREEIPKYLFTAGFKKSKVLFGENKLRDNSPILVVEGVLDTIWLDQHNYSSVAVLGASVSKYQIDLLGNLNPSEIVLCLDNDRAGQEGIIRALKTKGETLDVAFEDRFMISFVDFPDKYKDFQEIRNKEELDLIIRNRSFLRRTDMGIVTFEEHKPKKSSETANEYVEYYFQPGDAVFFTMLASGDDRPEVSKVEKRWLDGYFMYMWSTGSNQWTSLMDHPDIDNSVVPADVRSRFKISFWIYIHEIHHSLEHRKVIDGTHQELIEQGIWEEAETAGGRKIFKEEVNDLRIITTSNSNWKQQISPIGDESGALNKVVMKMVREGKGIDTRYFISPTAINNKIPEDVLEKANTVESIKDYFYRTQGGGSPKEESVSGSASSNLF